jgi:hypothetical protein
MSRFNSAWSTLRLLAGSWTGVVAVLALGFQATHARASEGLAPARRMKKLLNRRMKQILTIGAGLAALLALPVPAAAKGCDRPCLERMLDRYLAHVIGRRADPALLAAAPNIRENTLAVALDKGVWPTLRRKRAGWVFADPAAGQVAFAGAFETRIGGLLPLFVRLKLEGGRIKESEVAYNTGPNRFFHPEELLEPDLIYDAIVPSARRSSRAELIAVAQAYLDGIGAHGGAKVPIGYRCDKYYLGGKVTNAGAAGVGTCLESFNGVRADPPAGRRFPIVDVERGLVVVSFLMPNSYKDKPDSTYECEIIKIVDGKIRSVEEFGNVAPYPPRSGFAR